MSEQMVPAHLRGISSGLLEIEPSGQCSQGDSGRFTHISYRMSSVLQVNNDLSQIFGLSRTGGPHNSSLSSIFMSGSPLGALERPLSTFLPSFCLATGPFHCRSSLDSSHTPLRLRLCQRRDGHSLLNGTFKLLHPRPLAVPFTGRVCGRRGWSRHEKRTHSRNVLQSKELRKDMVGRCVSLPLYYKIHFWGER